MEIKKNQRIDYSPIGLFVFNRLEHLKEVVKSLQQCPESIFSDLIIFSDGSRSKDDEINVSAVRSYLRTINGFKTVKIEESSKNLGLANSIIGGVTKIVNEYGRVIVVEDDLLVSPIFLTFMNKALDFYENDEKVISIHGYSVPIKISENYFLRGADCWGWGTWVNKWKYFEPDGKILLNKLKKRKDLSDFEFNFTYQFLDMLKSQVEGSNNSWAIRWYASAFLLDMYTLYPAQSLVKNIGLDGTGVHCEAVDDGVNDVSIDIKTLSFSDSIKEDITIRNKIENYYFSKRGIKGKILCKIKQFLNFI